MPKTLRKGYCLAHKKDCPHGGSLSKCEIVTKFVGEKLHGRCGQFKPFPTNCNHNKPCFFDGNLWKCSGGKYPGTCNLAKNKASP